MRAPRQLLAMHVPRWLSAPHDISPFLEEQLIVMADMINGLIARPSYLYKFTYLCICNLY